MSSGSSKSQESILPDLKNVHHKIDKDGFIYDDDPDFPRYFLRSKWYPVDLLPLYPAVFAEIIITKLSKLNNGQNSLGASNLKAESPSKNNHSSLPSVSTQHQRDEVTLKRKIHIEDKKFGHEGKGVQKVNSLRAAMESDHSIRNSSVSSQLNLGEDSSKEKQVKGVKNKLDQLKNRFRKRNNVHSKEKKLHLEILPVIKEPGALISTPSENGLSTSASCTPRSVSPYLERKPSTRRRTSAPISSLLTVREPQKTSEPVLSPVSDTDSKEDPKFFGKTRVIFHYKGNTRWENNVHGISSDSPFHCSCCKFYSLRSKDVSHVQIRNAALLKKRNTKRKGSAMYARRDIEEELCSVEPSRTVFKTPKPVSKNIDKILESEHRGWKMKIKTVRVRKKLVFPDKIEGHKKKKLWRPNISKTTMIKCSSDPYIFHKFIEKGRRGSGSTIDEESKTFLEKHGLEVYVSSKDVNVEENLNLLKAQLFKVTLPQFKTAELVASLAGNTSTHTNNCIATEITQIPFQRARSLGSDVTLRLRSSDKAKKIRVKNPDWEEAEKIPSRCSLTSQFAIFPIEIEMQTASFREATLKPSTCLTRLQKTEFCSNYKLWKPEFNSGITEPSVYMVQIFTTNDGSIVKKIGITFETVEEKSTESSKNKSLFFVNSSAVTALPRTKMQNCNEHKFEQTDFQAGVLIPHPKKGNCRVQGVANLEPVAIILQDEVSMDDVNFEVSLSYDPQLPFKCNTIQVNPVSFKRKRTRFAESIPYATFSIASSVNYPTTKRAAVEISIINPEIHSESLSFKQNFCSTQEKVEWEAGIEILDQFFSPTSTLNSGGNSLPDDQIHLSSDTSSVDRATRSTISSRASRTSSLNTKEDSNNVSDRDDSRKTSRKTSKLIAAIEVSQLMPGDEEIERLKIELLSAETMEDKRRIRKKIRLLMK